MSVTARFECPRCGDEIEEAHPLDNTVHPDEPYVCDDCLEPDDEVFHP